ncbi:protein O-GlcNAcase-like [Babylonia areolata]|uniref:protein O-GlcNAcase-like n=1 Tax=Babylonia areolata TaxID=304850 RepID=UPI003FD0B499
MKDFTAGVVEGFYGVPWTGDQRRILFDWMQKMGLNTYMYAPKNDHKHRAYWRDLYSVEEADSLTSLIESAHEKGVTFVYAISPGLDITFSNAKDVQILKRKLEQVHAFGCRAFALLFDDIDPALSEADQNTFSSSACAQASLTNEIYEHLSQSKLFFCPTEYCATRALPSVLTSEYLTTLGSKLLPSIDIMWTGCKVISKKITIQTLEDITTVLKRPPVIWDNIHANDYDPRRVFLGPYDGRSPEIIPYIRGVMTNPNCEFEANYIACHTLGQWSKSNPDGVKKDIISGERLSPVLADIKLEIESFSCSEDLPSLDHRYLSCQALKTAIKDWLIELASKRDPPKRTLPASFVVTTPPDVSTTPVTSSLPAVTADLSTCDSSSVDSGVELSPVTDSAFLKSSIQPQPINSLVGDSSSDVSESVCDSVSDVVSDCSSEAEPMECVQSSSTGLVASNLNVMNKELVASPSTITSDCSTDGLMQVEEIVQDCDQSVSSVDSVQDCSQSVVSDSSIIAIPPSLLTEEDVCLLIDLFYLPFEHGSSSLQLLQCLHWLITNAHCLQATEDLTKVAEWRQQLCEFEQKVQCLDILLMRLFVGPNKAVLCDLYAYLWDMKGVLGTCLAFVKWLEHGVACNISAQTTAFATWFSKGYKEAFTSGDQEPWIFRGGLQAELQRLLPICMAHDLFLIKTPDLVVQKLYTFRPYSQQDETAVYDLCLKTCDEGLDGSDILTQFPQLLGDRLIGNFVSCSPEFCFVAEDGESVCGYVMAAPDAKDLASKSNDSWMPAMQEKYPKPAKEVLDSAEEMMVSFHTEPLAVKEAVYLSYPSVLRLDVLVSRMYDPAVPRRLLACALCALKAVGSRGVHTKLNSGDKFMMDFYSKLGFFAVTTTEDDPDVLYMGRLI